jgi:hypothetical protein
MLVDNKFIIILIPRCATTSFVSSCQEYNIPTKSGLSDVGGYDTSISFVTKRFTHWHCNISQLTSKLGNDYPIIAVKRNQHDLFISLWKIILRNLSEHFLKTELVEKLSKLKIDDILFFGKNEYSLISDTERLTKMFFIKNNIPHDKILFKYMSSLLYKPPSYWHNFDKRIIWFDFNQLNELENWVSNKLDMDFKLKNINSSKKVISELKNDEYFRQKFDYIYSKYEIIKENKTMI